ncbi:hypothetical protein F4553_000698 [Allocatelliglobosispora scoriae]|uniref:SGNH/GDSL hydrolase family protein n=1 Tax=Allocatelliglobosispora scoriae TaxID=643052 RepID=A0A841BJH2_9ACTN|nr:hypothetical protein [Allocatelliglobosispora scoriae]MBB5867319.1 hypothetical protein [Allocatelliglobosispora scoriae]
MLPLRLRPHLRSRSLRAAAAALVSATTAAALMAVSLQATAAPAPETRTFPQSVTELAAPCERILEGTQWVFDPCIPEGEPLPDDVLAALEEVRNERANCGSPSPSATATTTPTASPSPSASTSASPSPTASPSPSATVKPTPTIIKTIQPTQTIAPPGADRGTAALPTTTATATVAPTLSVPASPTATVSPSASASPSLSPSVSPSATNSPSPSASPCPSGSPTASPTTSPSTSPSSSPSPSASSPTPSPTSSSPAPSGCVVLTGSPLDDAKKDRIDCRDPKKIPDPGGAIVLTATGDSVTSAHHQWGYGTGVCNQTSADARGLTGNHGGFSYAGRYFGLNPNIIDYHNMARTGFGTTEMLGAAAGTRDACTNPWARAVSPVPLAAARIVKAKADGHKAYHVSTGGINNTNWTSVLSQLIKCRALEFAQQTIIPLSSINWAAVGGRAGIVTNGGSCVLRVRNPIPFMADFFHRIGVPRYDGPAQAAGITAGVRATVAAILAAGADKFVWMLYYNINPANIDIGNFAWTMVRAYAPAWIVAFLPPAATPLLVPLIDPMWVGAVTALINAMNAAIIAGIPANAKVRAQAAPAFVAADIQVTAIGGSPHPSAAGQTKLANTLNAAFNAIP